MKPNGVREYINTTAESTLFGYFLRKYLWAEPIAPSDIDDYYFSIRFIKNISICYFVICIILFGLNSSVLWYAPSTIAFTMPEYYLGIAISGILAGISYFSVKHIRSYMVNRSRDKIKGLKISYYFSISINLVFFLALFAFPLYFVDIPFVFFPLYYMFFSVLFALIALLVYFTMRIQNDNYRIDTTLIDEIKRAKNNNHSIFHS